MEIDVTFLEERPVLGKMKGQEKSLKKQNIGDSHI